MGIYFDHSASGLLSEDVLSYYLDALKNFNFNPASLHADGRKAREAVQVASRRIAACLDCQPEDIIYTSGGSESINTAVAHTVLASQKRGGRLLSFSGEHPATRESLKFWAELMQRKMLLLPETAGGKADFEALEAALKEEAAEFLSLMWVNNQSGAVNEPARAADLLRSFAPAAKLHIDAVQALGKLPLSFRKTGADFMSFSLHKIGLPKGIGLLLAKKNIPLIPLIHGGGQQKGRRSGTENPPLVLAAAYALEILQKNSAADLAKVRLLRHIFLERLKSGGAIFRLLSPEDGVPHILSLYLPELRAESLQTALSADSFDVSIGSACFSSKNKAQADPSLLALGLDEQSSKYVLRVSFAAVNREEDCLRLAERILNTLKQYGRPPR